MADLPDPLPLSYTGNDTVPPGAVLKIIGVADGGGLSVERPGVDGEPNIVVNGLSPIPAGNVTESSGQGFLGPRVVAAYDPEDGDPEAGETWGPGSDSFLLRKDLPGFMILGGAGRGLVNAVRVPAGELTIPGRNYLINGTFCVFQRERVTPQGEKALTGNYAFDRWYTQHDAGNALQFSPQNFGPAGTSSSGRIANTGNASAGLFLCQPIEFDGVAVRGADLEFSISAIADSNVTVHMAVWCGNGVNPPKSLVTSWDGNHTPTFTTSGNITKMGEATISATTGVWSDGSLAFTPPSNNIFVTAAFWVEGLPAGERVFLAKAAIQAAGTVWTEPSRNQTVIDCQRFYYAPAWTEKTFQYFPGGTVPFTSGNTIFTWVDIPPMRTYPTLRHSITGPISGLSPVAGYFRAIDLDKGADVENPATVSAGNLTISLATASDDVGTNGGMTGWSQKRLAISSTSAWTGTTLGNGDTIYCAGKGIISLAFDAEM